MAYYIASTNAVTLNAPVKKMGDGGGGKSRPIEGKMFPRGKP